MKGHRKHAAVAGEVVAGEIEKHVISRRTEVAFQDASRATAGPLPFNDVQG